jgi:hypothetical protein
MDKDDFIDLMVAAVAVCCVVLVYVLAKMGAI